jgi:hypothetical protein
MKKSDLQALIEEVVQDSISSHAINKKVVKESIPPRVDDNAMINVSGYGVITVKQAKARLLANLEEVQKLIELEAYGKVNSLLKTNGLVPMFAEALYLAAIGKNIMPPNSKHD